MKADTTEHEKMEIFYGKYSKYSIINNCYFSAIGILEIFKTIIYSQGLLI